MAYVNVEVDIEDYLDEVSTETLREELKSRKDKQPDDSPGAPHEWMPRGMADDLRTAFYARNAARFEALLTVLEPQDKPTKGLAA